MGMVAVSKKWTLFALIRKIGASSVVYTVQIEQWYCGSEVSGGQ